MKANRCSNDREWHVYFPTNIEKTLKSIKTIFFLKHVKSIKGFNQDAILKPTYIINYIIYSSKL